MTDIETADAGVQNGTSFFIYFNNLSLGFSALTGFGAVFMFRRDHGAKPAKKGVFPRIAPMNKDKSPKSLEDLDLRLRQARSQMQPPAGGKGADGKPAASGLGMAFRIGAELVAGLAVGTGIGLGLDAWLETTPWFLIVFFILGAAAGMLNVYRTAKGLGLAAGFRPSKDKDTAVNDDG